MCRAQGSPRNYLQSVLREKRKKGQTRAAVMIKKKDRELV